MSPSAPGLPALRLRDEVAVRGVRRERVAEPPQRPGGRQHHAHRVPRARHGVAEDVHARLRVGAVGVERAEHHARRAEHHRQRAGLDDADAERARGLVAGPGGHRHAVGRGPGHLRRLQRARQPLARDLQGLEHLVAPAPARDVEQQRAGRVGDVDRAARRTAAAARSPWAAARARSARSASGSCSRSHSSFGAVKPVSARLPVSSTRRSKPTRRSISSHCAAVRWSFHRIAGRITRSAASSATSPCIWPLSPMPAISSQSSASSAASVARHQSSGSCSAQPGRGVDSG